MKRLLKYLKAAFFVREKIPLLGHMPVNVLAMLMVVALGFGHPGFWLIGLLGETVFLWMMMASKRFRNVVDAIELKGNRDQTIEKTKTLVDELSDENRSRYQQLNFQKAEVETYYQKYAQDDLIADENLINLESLSSVFLRLLVAKQHLTSPHRKTDVKKIREKIEALKGQVDEATELTKAAIESRNATCDLLQKRLSVFEKRSQAIDEIQADLNQIEAQFQLAVDSATIRAKPAEAKLDMDLAKVMMSTPDYLVLGEDTRPEMVMDALNYETE